MRRRDGIGAVVLTTAIVLAAAKGRIRRHEIVEHSMEPALHPGDYTLSLLRSKAPARGTVVVFDHPEQAGFELVKRVIGLPGERVQIAGGQVHIDDRTLAEPWADGPTQPDGSWTLGSDQCFVLGDRRALSAADSRALGPVPADALKWHVALCYWPPSHIGIVRGPQGAWR